MPAVRERAWSAGFFLSTNPSKYKRREDMTEVQKLLDELDRHVKAAKAEDDQNEMTEINLGHHTKALHYAGRASAWETMRWLLKTMRAFYSESKSERSVNPAP